jgi:aminoglycoside phosphotransferase (APT) family kinase protein
MTARDNDVSFPHDHIAAVAREALGRAVRHVEAMTDGYSTHVYCVSAAGRIWYVRVLPRVGESFAPEAAVHEQLRELGVLVPAVVFFAERHPLLERSVMIVEALLGEALFHAPASNHKMLEQVVTDAGRDLAHLNSLFVEGFGRVERLRSADGKRHAPWPTYRAYALDAWEANTRFLARQALTLGEAAALDRIVARYDAWLECGQSRLVHGDFSIRHIFHHQGVYSGIIDLSDMCGASLWDDLAYFHMRDGARVPERLLPALLRGYAEITPLPANVEQRIRFASILRNVATLPDALTHRPDERLTRHQLERLREDLAAL